MNSEPRYDDLHVESEADRSECRMCGCERQLSWCGICESCHRAEDEDRPASLLRGALPWLSEDAAREITR